MLLELSGSEQAQSLQKPMGLKMAWQWNQGTQDNLLIPHSRKDSGKNNIKQADEREYSEKVPATLQPTWMRKRSLAS